MTKSLIVVVTAAVSPSHTYKNGSQNGMGDRGENKVALVYFEELAIV